MKKELLLKDIAESGYNIGYAAKKHLATYDIVEKAPGWIGIFSFSIGVLALTIRQFDNKVLASFMLIIAYAIFYFNSYQDTRSKYADVGSRLTSLFTSLRSLYNEVKSHADDAPLDQLQGTYQAIVAESQSIGISKQIFLSDWYAHYKFFWQAERNWLEEKRPFTLWRDMIPLSATITGIILLIAMAIWIAFCFSSGAST